VTSQTKVVGVTAAIYRYPVKSMLGEELVAASIESRGLVGDRAYALIDQETGRVVSVKRPKRWSRMFDLCAFTDGCVWVRFPGGETLSIDDGSLPARLQQFFGRVVSISSSPAPGAHFDEVWLRELKDGVNPYFGRPSRFEDGDEIVAAGSSMGTEGNFFNDSPIHLLTTSSLRALSEVAPSSRFEAKRFRPNLVLDTRQSGFVENEWRGRVLRIGSVALEVTIVVPRCVMTTLAQDGLPHDPDILRTITVSNAFDALSTGTRYPCVGAYAKVLHPGIIGAGEIAIVE
jgi:uncharacterized protein